ncbi:PqqD family protein [Jidongwangia harbinensis]|uniref:PqqD family protein n=1 Tax=Jidongwangia harbinensis TaxID=2878561 RepID=UPI001CD952F5|nr:PqqD family protein [Jidongwangia harbinensis]MCA2214115.1 PqqD family protein [Jidongwangia harbinensis]
MLTLQPDAVQWHLVEGEVMALDVVRREYFSVNGSGALLWRLLAEGTSDVLLARELSREYGLAEATAEADVADFLAVLRERRLLADT